MVEIGIFNAWKLLHVDVLCLLSAWSCMGRIFLVDVLC